MTPFALNFHHAVHCVPFADPARSISTPAVEPHRLGGLVQLNVPVAHLAEAALRFRPVGQVPAALYKTPRPSSAGPPDIERPFALPAVFHARRQAARNSSGETFTGRSAACRLTSLHSLSGR